MSETNLFNKENIDLLLSDDNLEEVLVRLKGVKEKKKFKAKVLKLESRLSNLDDIINTGVLSASEILIERGKIRTSVFDLVDEAFNKMEDRKQKGQLIREFKHQVYTYRSYIVICILMLSLVSFAYIELAKEKVNHIPFTLKNKIINKDNIKLLSAHIEKAANGYTTDFKDVLNSISEYALDREEYLKRFKIENLDNDLKSAKQINQDVTSFFNNIEQNGITFRKLAAEVNLRSEMKEAYKDDFYNIHKEMDDMCSNIQSAIDKRTTFLFSLKDKVKGEHKLESFIGEKAYVKKIISNAVDQPVYAMVFRIYVQTYLGDTIMQMRSEINETAGIGKLYKSAPRGFYYDSKAVVNNLKKNEGKCFFISELEKINVDGKNYIKDFEDGWMARQNFSDLPHGCTFYKNYNYTTPGELKGACPYIFDKGHIFNKLNQLNSEINNRVEQKGFKMYRLLEESASKFDMWSIIGPDFH